MRPVSLAVRFYAALLELDPRPESVRRDMVECFQDLCMEAHRRRGWVGVLVVWGRTMLDAPRSLVGAHLLRMNVERGMTMRWVDDALQDLRFALRGLWRNPGFTTLAVLSLGLGVGANTTMFSMIDAVVWRQLPVEDPDELVRVFRVRDGPTDMSYPDFVDLTEQVSAFEGAFLHDLETFGFVTEDASRVVHGETVTGGYFDVLGVTPAEGRLLTEEDDRPGAPLALVLSHDLWQRAFAGEPVVGVRVELNEHPATVVGVTPEGFDGAKLGLAMDLWVPMRAWGAAQGWGARWEQARGNTSSLMVARLADGRDLARAREELTAVGARLAEAYPDTNVGTTFTALPERAGSISEEPGLPNLIGLVAVIGSGLVLIVACGNVASLLLARAVGRRPEIAVRVAMGGSRRRLLKQLLVENTVLASAAAAVGLILATAASAVMRDRFMPSIPYRLALDTSPSLRAVLVAGGGALLAVLVFGLLPSLQASRPRVVAALRRDSVGGDGGRGSRLLDAVVVGVFSVSLAALFLASQFVSNLWNVRAVDPGLEVEGRVVATVDLSLGGYAAGDAPAYFDELARSARARPEISEVEVTSAIPHGDWSSSSRVFADDREYGPEEIGVSTWHAAISPGYLDLLGVEVEAGRGVGRSDRADTREVVVVNRALADRLWPGEEPLGRRIRFRREAGGESLEVVGVTETGRYLTVTEAPRPAMYFPMTQAPRSRAVIVARGADPERLVPVLRDVARSVDPAVPLFDVKGMERLLDNAYWLHRMGAELALAIGLLSALLAAAGLYGIMLFRVRRRRPELGIRIALGAGSSRVLRLVLSGSARLVAVGLVLGGGLSLLAGRVVRGLVYGVEGTGAHLVLAAAALGALALVATLVPAYTATRSDPLRVIRAD